MSLLQKYNALDTIATFQLWENLSASAAERPEVSSIYEEAKAVSSPLLYAMLRGILIDEGTVSALRKQFEAESKRLEASLDNITRPLGLGAINLGSPTQIAWMLECLGQKLPIDRDTGNPSVSREILEGIAKSEPDVGMLCRIILSWRNRKKMLDVLKPELVDADGRMRTFYKVAGTKTDRLSSSKNALWTGMNMQNIKRDEDETEVGHASIRSAFWADPGYSFINVDLERADSWAVALEVFKYLGDRSYLEACRARDLHTYVAKLVWPGLDWPNTEEGDIALAKTFFYRQYDYRFMSKKLQHGSNYLGSWWELARQMKIPQEVARAGQDAYFAAFPGIRRWQTTRAGHLQRDGHLVNLFDRVRNVHMRLDSKDTLKKAIAHLGQSVTARAINRGIIRLWALQLQMPWLDIQFLAQVHDSALIQCPTPNVPEVLSLMQEVMLIPITVTSPRGETLTESIPLEASVGWNWAAASPSNPDGLIKVKPGKRDVRERHREPPRKALRLMDRRVSSVHGRLAVA